MMRQRSSTVEPVLGTLINLTGMRRIYTRGINGANKQVYALRSHCIQSEKTDEVGVKAKG